MSDDPELTDRQRKVLASMHSAIKLAPIPLRTCGECAKCCEGWLSGSAYGHPFSPGNPCFFLEKTCSIYQDRPVVPCQNYRCAWLAEDTFPMWMKPSLVNMIISKRVIEEHHLSYYVIDHGGESFDPRALAWLHHWAASTRSNVEYRLNGETTRTGSPEFVDM
jgi:hypothetical protein